jgi:pyruvate kinase
MPDNTNEREGMTMRRQRCAKIVATLGPASSTAEQIRALFAAGADVFRLNFSHGEHADHAKRVKTLRALEEETGRPISIMMDLQGPKLRVGTFKGGRIELHAGRHFRLDLDKAPGDDKRVCLPHPEIFKALHPGDALLLDDGKIRLKVLTCDAQSAETEVISGGPLSDRKGVNVPNAVLDLSPLTDKDRRDLDFGLDQGVDWVALSFVQRPEDIAEARKLIAGRATIIAKLEKPSAIKYLDAIIEQTDAVMVARGDLGVEMAPEDVPPMQKRIVRACRMAGKPVIVATQMLESMITAPVPTRAEVSDVATAVFEGADAVMLSAESAAGQFPVEAVATMDRIARQVERDPNYRGIIHAQRQEPEPTGADAIAAAARQIAETLNLAAVVCYTTSGATGLRASRERPSVPVIVISPVLSTARRLSLAWGLHCVVSDDARDENDMVDRACQISFQEELAKPGQRIITTAGVPFGTPGSTNMLRIAFIGSDGRGGL